MHRLRAQVILLLFMTVMLAGCDAFRPTDCGTTAWPCHEQSDCQDGYLCDPMYEACVPDPLPTCTHDRDCYETLHGLGNPFCNHQTDVCDYREEEGFGEYCADSGSCTNDFPVCAALADNPENRHCTRDCTDTGNCTDILGLPLCMPTRDPGVFTCQRPLWSYGIGAPCTEEPFCQKFDEYLRCVEFWQEWNGTHLRVCAFAWDPNGDCGPGFEHGITPQSASEPYCGLPAWHGFGRACTEAGDECDSTALYPICSGAHRCTRACSGKEDCPDGHDCQGGLCQ